MRIVRELKKSYDEILSNYDTDIFMMFMQEQNHTKTWNFIKYNKEQGNKIHK